VGLAGKLSRRLPLKRRHKRKRGALIKGTASDTSIPVASIYDFIFRSGIRSRRPVVAE